uniref:Uncharacterized protein n=1 Tax=Opuntia streptacantha TaxID=393608 RepID=A0A7C9EEV7_OPUST
MRNPTFHMLSRIPKLLSHASPDRTLKQNNQAAKLEKFINVCHFPSPLAPFPSGTFSVRLSVFFSSPPAGSPLEQWLPMTVEMSASEAPANLKRSMAVSRFFFQLSIPNLNSI